MRQCDYSRACSPFRDPCVDVPSVPLYCFDAALRLARGRAGGLKINTGGGLGVGGVAEFFPEYITPSNDIGGELLGTGKFLHPRPPPRGGHCPLACLVQMCMRFVSYDLWYLTRMILGEEIHESFHRAATKDTCARYGVDRELSGDESFCCSASSVVCHHFLFSAQGTKTWPS
jgi:hypothetical protein